MCLGTDRGATGLCLLATCDRLCKATTRPRFGGAFPVVRRVLLAPSAGPEDTCSPLPPHWPAWAGPLESQIGRPAARRRRPSRSCAFGCHGLWGGGAGLVRRANAPRTETRPHRRSELFFRSALFLPSKLAGSSVQCLYLWWRGHRKGNRRENIGYREYHARLASVSFPSLQTHVEQCNQVRIVDVPVSSETKPKKDRAERHMQNPPGRDFGIRFG